MNVSTWDISDILRSGVMSLQNQWAACLNQYSLMKMITNAPFIAEINLAVVRATICLAGDKICSHASILADHSDPQGHYHATL